jgi:hypothetical protein
MPRGFVYSVVGMVAGAAWRSKERSLLIAALVLVAGALYVVTMNALSLPAHVDAPFEAGNKGSVVEAEFSVATAKTYTFYLNLYFREGDRQNKERVRKLAGTGAYRDGRHATSGGWRFRLLAFSTSRGELCSIELQGGRVR